MTGLHLSQSRGRSLLEAFTNVAVGFGVALGTQLAVFPLFGIHVSFGQDLAIGGVFTVVSIIRSYCLRRLFNRWRPA